MLRRESMCDGCPFNPERIGPPLDHDVRKAIAERIRNGEQWICHQTCDGPRIVLTSQLCAGAPTTS
jgi:hypothetical protein